MYGLKYLLCQPKGTRCNIVHAIYQTKESIAKLAKIFHSAADKLFLNSSRSGEFLWADYSSTTD